jgi:hypothetical protein
MRLKALLPVLALALLVSVFTSGKMAYAASMPAHSNSAWQVYTISYFDGSGHLTKTWKGSFADAEKIKSQYRQAFLKKFAKQLQGAPLTRQNTKRGITPNINRVDSCILPNSFFNFFNNGPLVCFANSGTQNVAIYSVYEVDSGANNVTYTFNGTRACISHRMGPNSTAFYSSPTIFVYQITIH